MLHPPRKLRLRMAPSSPLPLTSLRHEAIEAFTAAFGGGPDACAVAPGRVNLIGEHTDSSGGYVLPMAIDRACIAAARTMPGGTWRFRSTHGGSDTFCEHPIDAHEARRTLPAWSMYPVGVAMLLAEQAAAARRAWCTSAAVALGAGTLREATWERLEQSPQPLAPDERLAAEHVVSENLRTVECARLLIDAHAAGWPADSFTAFGVRMTESHRSLRDRLRVSCPELDSLVELALDSPGVWGSRMTGGGFGGCTVTLVDPSRHLGPSSWNCVALSGRQR